MADSKESVKFIYKVEILPFTLSGVRERKFIN